MNDTNKSDEELQKLRDYYSCIHNFDRKACAVARDYITINRCKDCYGPVIKGYCCTTCGSRNP